MTSDLQAWSRIAREVLGTAYPWVPGHVVLGPQDTSVVPHELHPAFHGALDWHSSAHMQWSLVTLLARYADSLTMAERAEVRGLLGERLTVENVAVEVAYLRERPGFERPYGWAWAAQLVAATRELAGPAVSPVVEGAAGERAAGERAAGERAAVEGADVAGPVVEGADVWAEALAPLGDLIAERVVAWIPRQAYPVRHGKHQNDAFALLLLLDAYGEQRLDRPDVVAAARERALAWFADDEPAPTDQEPGGSDFLSPALTEALLLTRVLPPDEAGPWLGRFLPGLGEGRHTHLLSPPTVRDPTDGQGAHLLGLALSRAWALRGLAGWVSDAAADRLRTAADEQEGAVLAHITDGDFMATHWLVSFALLARDGLAPTVSTVGEGRGGPAVGRPCR